VNTKRPHLLLFEWDEVKRRTNLERRGLDFADVDLLFDAHGITTAPSRRNQEDRFVSTAAIGAKLYTVVWTWRGAYRRIISFRRASIAEERAYRQAFG
jgi:uncharacterized DUF497 family protein